MPDCYIIGRAIGTCYDEEKPERDPCGLPEGALVYEDVEKSTEDEEPVFVRGLMNLEQRRRIMQQIHNPEWDKTP